MTTPNNGGPVFPVEHYTQSRYENTGMTMRDYFAAKAMQALATRPDSYEFDTKNGVEAIAANAYAISDAMLAAREKQS